VANLEEVLMAGHQRLLAARRQALVSHAEVQRQVEPIAADARALRAARDRLQTEIDLLAASVEPRQAALEAEIAMLRQALAAGETDPAASHQRPAPPVAPFARLSAAVARLKARFQPGDPGKH
jgi:predicted phage gp36 major capsid-like protein